MCFQINASRCYYGSAYKQPACMLCIQYEKNHPEIPHRQGVTMAS